MRAAVDTWVRPVLEADGGGIEVVAVAPDEVTVRLIAACSGCPGAPYTLEAVVRPAVESAVGHGVALRVVRAPSLPGLAPPG